MVFVSVGTDSEGKTGECYERNDDLGPSRGFIICCWHRWDAILELRCSPVRARSAPVRYHMGQRKPLQVSLSPLGALLVECSVGTRNILHFTPENYSETQGECWHQDVVNRTQS